MLREAAKGTSPQESDMRLFILSTMLRTYSVSSIWLDAGVW